jgi:hypothetical protein
VIDPGFYTDMSAEEYHSAVGVSSTHLNWMHQGFDYYQWMLTQKKEPTEAMLFGSATHCLLESRIKGDEKVIAENLVVAPEAVGGYRSVKFKRFLEEQGGKCVVTEEDYELAKRIVNAVLDHPTISNYFKGGYSEPSVFEYYPGTRILVKCRPDYLIVDDHRALSINFKTSDDVSERKFVYKAAELGYDWQSAFYIDILNHHFKRSFDEVHVVASSNPDGPVQIAEYTIDDEDLDFARSQFRVLLSRLEECRQTNTWPGRNPGLQSIKLPPFARRVVTL